MLTTLSLPFVRFLNGVPQGSVLGPILFLLYINAIGKTCQEDSVLKFFADDVKLFSDKVKHSASPSSSLQLLLDNLVVLS